MYTLEEIQKVTFRPDVGQCAVGLKFILERFIELQPTAFMMVGPGPLHDFNLFKNLMPEGSLAMGIDYRVYLEWLAVPDLTSPYKLWLIPTGSDNPVSEERVSTILNGRKLDLLFIDGDHSEYFVQNDWDRYSKFVRPGGMVVFHDYNPTGNMDPEREGAAIVCAILAKQGYTIQQPPVSSIGTAYLYMP